jgi:predicted PurR-regulated permease PerM
MSYTKHYLTIAALMMLLLAAAIVTNPINVAIAQQPTTTTTNQSDINVDEKIDELKAKFPELNSPQGNEVKDLIQKVLSLDKEQALKVLAAFHILRNLQEYKEISSGGTNSTG